MGFYNQKRCHIIGYTEGTGARKDLFGSLILAREDDEGYLRYCGKVGTGFNNAELKQVTKILREYEVEKELVEVPDPHQPVKAPLEVTVKFYETTSGGVFRFPAVLKDSRGINQIHFNGDTIPVKLRPRDLRSMLGGLK